MTDPIPAPIKMPDYIDKLAVAVNCPRHLPHINGCRYDHDKPCYCREWVNLIYGTK